MLDQLGLVDPQANRRYLLEKTQHMIGGFGKTAGEPPGKPEALSPAHPLLDACLCAGSWTNQDRRKICSIHTLALRLWDSLARGQKREKKEKKALTPSTLCCVPVDVYADTWTRSRGRHDDDDDAVSLSPSPHYTRVAQQHSRLMRLHSHLHEYQHQYININISISISDVRYQPSIIIAIVRPPSAP